MSTESRTSILFPAGVAGSRSTVLPRASSRQVGTDWSSPRRLGLDIGVASNGVTLLLVGVCGLLLAWLVSDVVRVSLRQVNPWFPAVVGGTVVLVALSARAGSRAGLFFALLLGVPIESFPWPLVGEERWIRRKARWFAAFLREQPRSCNTPGAHLASGAIAVKKVIKTLALRRERKSSAIRDLMGGRAAAIRGSNRASQLAFAALATNRLSAVEHGRREGWLRQWIADIDAELLQRRLQIQDEVVQQFLIAWRACHREGLIRDDLYEMAAAQFRQPADEAPALLPRGLVRSRIAVVFEHGMFIGRLVMALLFVATLHTSYLLYALVLFGLDLYVVEPVMFKLHMSSLDLLVDSLGHKSVELERYVAAATSHGGTFRFPIIVPKFSSNPAWTELASMIEAAVGRCGVKPVKVTPFAMRAGNKQTIIELPDGPAAEVIRQASVLRAALETQWRASRARFPLDLDISVQGQRLAVTITSDDEKIWAMIGEDANQAFTYLWKNLRALRDSLSHLGARFQPAFIFASNSKDGDVIQYEMDQLARLQSWSESEYRGQVGFLYLLRGGEWYIYNARLRRFDAKDKDFASALPDIEKRLADASNPARESVVSACANVRARNKAVAKDEVAAPADPAQRREVLAAAFNEILGQKGFYRCFDEFDFASLPEHQMPTAATLALLARRRAGASLSPSESVTLNRDLLLTALPVRGAGGFFKKVGNDIAVHELLVAGKTRPTVCTDRRIHEHVQDGSRPNYGRVWGDFARYTGLRGSNEQIQQAILRGEDVVVDSVPEVAAIFDDKNSFGPAEIEKGLAMMLHPENRHIVIGVPRIQVTLPEDLGRPVSSPYIVGVRAARETHNATDALTKVRVFDSSSAAYGKWFLRPKAYFSHYALEVLNAAHALSHDFQQSYLVAGAGGRLAAFSEALYGPSTFEVRCEMGRALGRRPEILEGTFGAFRDRGGDLPFRIAPAGGFNDADAKVAEG